jgi:hypothetical protein
MKCATTKGGVMNGQQMVFVFKAYGSATGSAI